MKFTDVDLGFVAANSLRADYPYFPDRQLIRLKFFEAVIRLALDKYFKSKICSTPLEAIKAAFEQHFKPCWAQYDCHKVRVEKIWRQENDIVLKRMEPIIKALWNQNSGGHSNSKSNIFMGMDEFCYMVEAANCFSDQFGTQQLPPLFNLSMMTQTDELSKTRFMDMSMTEFYEAICRVADKMPNENLPNFYPIHKSVSPFYLDKKLESLIISMARNRLPNALITNLEKRYTAELDAAFAGEKLMKV